MEGSLAVPSSDVVFEAIGAALWFGALWYVAPLLGSARGGADRLRDALILGVAIPFVLAFAGLLWPIAIWLAMAALVAARIVVRGIADAPQPAPSLDRRFGTALPLMAAAAAGWPALVRPLLQGDSLGYHLPNAASWIQAHSLWVTTTNYWFYPGGSELFAAGVLAAAGTLAVGFAGLGALLFFGLRLSAWGVALGLRPWIAGALGALAMSSFTFAEQAGSLENDVWLAAFFLESLWLVRANLAGPLGRALAMTALFKPVGWLYAGLAIFVGNPPWRVILVALAPLGLWLLRDAILWDRAIIAPASVFYPNWFGTTILAHGWTGASGIGAALLGDGSPTAILFAAAFASMFFARDVRLRVAAAVSLAIFVLHPFGFLSAEQRIATGYSLRYAASFLALGGLFVAELTSRLRVLREVVGVVALVIAAYALVHLNGIYWNDATTHRTLLVVIVLGIAVLLPWERVRLRLLPAAGCALAAYAVVLAGSHPLDYYEDWLSHDGAHSTFFHWLAQKKPAALVGYGLRIGSVYAVSPTTRAIDTYVRNPCREAHNQGALLVVAGDVLVTVRTSYEPRRAFAERCGAIVFDDGNTIVVNPNAVWTGGLSR